MKKVPFVTKEQVEEIAKTYPTPFYLYDEKGIRENVRQLQQAFSWNKGYKEYFAVKATPNPFIMKLLKEEGVGADCSSYTELQMSEAVGITGHDIMFSSNETPAKDFEKAAKLGAIINFDDITHIDFFAGIAKFPETMCCRYNPGGDFAIHNQIMDSPEDAKYGMTRAQLTEAFLKLKAKGVKHFGLHAFLASNTVTNKYYPKLARILFETAVELQKETGVHIAFINLSGGIGIPYRPEQKGADVGRIGEGVRQAFAQALGSRAGEIALKSELGRFMTGPYGWLLTHAVHEKQIYKDYIGVDACAANLMRPAMYGAYHHIHVCGKREAPADHCYDVTGCLCENNYKFAVDRPLPQIALGDLLVIHDTGAHGACMGYQYNGRLRGAEVLYTQAGDFRLIRRAETPADYFATLV